MEHTGDETKIFFQKLYEIREVKLKQMMFNYFKVKLVEKKKKIINIYQLFSPYGNLKFSSLGKKNVFLCNSMHPFLKLEIFYSANSVVTMFYMHYLNMWVLLILHSK